MAFLINFFFKMYFEYRKERQSLYTYSRFTCHFVLNISCGKVGAIFTVCKAVSGSERCQKSDPVLTKNPPNPQH
jgi:hypothetical protein